MPSPPMTPRRSSNIRQSVPATSKSNPPKPTGIYELNTVQDRIRQWQSQGASTAPAPDAVSILSNPASDIERPNSRGSRSCLSSNKDGPSTKRRSGRNIERDGTERPREVRSSSTPRKRVIGDNNWQVKVKPKEPRSSNATPRSRDRTETATSDVDRVASPAEAEREERRRRMREAKRPRRQDDARLREIYGTNLPPAVDSDVPYENLNAQSDVDTDLARQFTRPNKPQVLSLSSDQQASIRPKPVDGQQRRRSKYVETLETATEPLDIQTKSKPRRGSIFNNGRDTLTKAEQGPTVSNRIPSIEAWLSEQLDDPFIETDEAPVEMPPPLKPRTRRRLSADTRPPIEDPNKMSESIPQDQSPSSRRKPRNSRDLEHTPPHITTGATFTGYAPGHDGLHESPDESSGGLKRRGARMSRLRDRSLNQKERPPEQAPSAPTQTQNPPAKVPETLDSYGFHLHKNLDREDVSPRPTANGRLSTIASVETFNSKVEQTAQDNQVTGDESWDFLKQDANGLKRRLTTHEDLMSQLSVARRKRNPRKANSIRRAQNEITTPNLTATELLDEIKADELKYMKELRTLVDGVIPVLLQCVLSKSDSVATASLFTSSKSGKDATRPIVDMGIALERLKSLHNRIPTGHEDGLLSWAQTAHKAYSDYLKAWRLGFQDVVVNLATKDGDHSEVNRGMERDHHGDVVTADGKKVDVAYLLKRPLVRVNKLSRSFTDLRAIVQKPSADRVATLFQELTVQARNRTQEEQGRLEDEAASNVDVAKARDLRTLTPLAEVNVNKDRNVKAKDSFNMTLYHTSGQRVDCRVEMIFRDNQTGPNSGGDILFCEVDDTGKWLLFAPTDIDTVSARKGDKPDDLVVMVRGTGRQAWHEMLELKADDADTANEWLQMLGSNPLPPKLVRSLSFLAREEAEKYASEAAAKPLSAEALKQINGSDLEIPIGEPSLVVQQHAKRRQASPERSHLEKPLPKLNFGGGLQRSSQQNWSSPTSSRINPNKHVGAASVVSSDVSTRSGGSTIYSDSSCTPTMSSTSVRPDFSKESESTTRKLSPADATKTKSSTPSQDLPSVTKVRGSSGPLGSTTITSSIAEKWASLTGTGKASASLPLRERREENTSEESPNSLKRENASSPQIRKHRPTSMPANSVSWDPDTKPGSSPRKESRALQSLADNFGGPKSTRESIQTEKAKKRRSSSPLKHEYAPSVVSSGDESDGSISDASDLQSEDEDTPTPLVSVPDMRRSSRGPPPTSFRQPSGSKTATLAPSDSASQGPYRSVPVVPASEKRKAVAMVCTWSDVHMWVPVNPTGDLCSVVISPGLVEVFEMGAAENLSSFSSPASSRENSLTLQPLVGFELTINVMMHGGTGLDITLRSPPTPNSRVKNASSTVLFRSSSLIEKELLYNLLNHSRMNNPTMLALIAARAKKDRDQASAASFGVGEPARHSRASSFGIFRFGRGNKGTSYRASSAPAPPSVSGETTESTGSMSRNLLQRLSAGSAFALNRSSVLRKASGTVASSSISGSSARLQSQSGYTPPNGPNVPTTSNAAVEGAGMVNNMKVRLHMRKSNEGSNAKWVDLGAVRLSILPATSNVGDGTTGDDQSQVGSGSNTPTRRRLSMFNNTPEVIPRTASASLSHPWDPAHSKRLVIVSADKTKPSNETFLDAVLPEEAFERVQRIGIAINVWKEEERIAKEGGVLLGKNTVWCLSFGSERECSWVYGLVGRYRYE